MKKLVILAVAAAVAVVGFNSETRSWCKTISRLAGDSFRKTVPIRLELERASEVVREIVPDIRNTILLTATEEAEIEKLDGKIALGQRSLVSAEAEILKLRDLACNTDKLATVVFNQQRLNHEDLKESSLTPNWLSAPISLSRDGRRTSFPIANRLARLDC